MLAACMRVSQQVCAQSMPAWIKQGDNEHSGDIFLGVYACGGGGMLWSNLAVSCTGGSLLEGEGGKMLDSLAT